MNVLPDRRHTRGRRAPIPIAVALQQNSPLPGLRFRRADNAKGSIYTRVQALLNRSQIRGFPMATVDTERFRLRNFVDKLVDSGECEVHNKPIDLLDVGGVLEGNPK